MAAPRTLSAQFVRREYSELHMGGAVRLVLYAPSDSAARAAARAAYGRIARLEDIMSDYRPDSEVRRLGRRHGEWVVVNDELFDVLALALRVAEETDGAFDPTVGPYVALWREARRAGRLPPAGDLADARRRVGWRKVELDSTRRAVRLDGAGMRLDLGGIAKGFILDRARETLAQHGVASVLLEAGGDVVVGEPPPGRPGWRIEISGAGPEVAARASSLAGAAVATSGGTEQFVVIDGARYSHVVDPRTGHGLTNGLVATVIASEGALADALATALTVLEGARAAALLRRHTSVIAELRDQTELEG